jgi:predicted small integral membrane protein
MDTENESVTAEYPPIENKKTTMAVYLLILLAFIVVGVLIYAGYMYMIERKADADSEREKKEMQGYMKLAREAGAFK